MKTHSGAKKRFSLTGTGKVKYKQAKMRHIMTKKSQSMKRKARKVYILNVTYSLHIKALFPNA
jgi:large subunit ribosomal protein L35